MMEFNLFTCEFIGEGLNISATIKRLGKPILKFNCQTKHLATAQEVLNDLINRIDFKSLAKLEDLPIEEDYFKVKNGVKK